MEIILSIGLGLVFLLVGGVLLFLIFANNKNRVEGVVLVDDEKERLKVDVENLRQEKLKKEGERETLLNQVATLKAESQAEIKFQQEKNSELQKRINVFENEQQQRDVETDRKLSELDNSRKALEQERERVIAKEKAKQEQEEENRTRIWNLHEQDSLKIMSEVCSRSEFFFTTYDNNKLPDEFDKSFKPDFMLKFLGQYLIFDAKLSKGKNLQNYINEQVKKTVEKIKKSPVAESIYKTLFFVIPTISINQISKFSYYEDGFHFYVIPIEAFEPLIASYKKLEDYDLAEAYDPQERENIIELIASFNHHVRKQNAMNILNTVEGLAVLNGAKSLPTDIIDSVDTRLKNSRITKFKESEIKRLISDPLEQVKDIEKLVKPKKAEIEKDDIGEVASDSLF